MDRAEVRIFAWLREGVGEMLAGIESPRSEGCLIFTHHRMWHIVVVRPGDRGPRGHRQSHRAETKVVDFDFDSVAAWLLCVPAINMNASAKLPVVPRIRIVFLIFIVPSP
jgi:hypothetical protein